MSLFLTQQGIISGSSGASTLLNGLKNYWPMEESSGTRWNTASGNEMSEVNSVGYVSGKVGDAANFISANNEGLRRALPTGLDGGNRDYTFSLWVNKGDTNTTAIVKMGGLNITSGSSLDYMLYATSSDLTFYTVTGTSTLQGVATDSALTVDTWEHVIFWYDSTAEKQYIRVNNGTIYELDVSATLPRHSATATYFQLGGGYGAIQTLEGYMDEVGMWDRVLTSAEHSELNNSGAGLGGLAAAEKTITLGDFTNEYNNIAGAHAGVRVDDIGFLYKTHGSTGQLATALSSSTNWIAPRNGGSDIGGTYEARVTSVTGTPFDTSPGTDGNWFTIGTVDRLWEIEQTTPGTSDTDFTLEIRLDGGAVLDSASITLTAIMPDVDTYYFDTSDEGPTDGSASWSTDANAFDNSTSTVSLASTGSSGVLSGGGTNAPASGGTIASVKARIYSNVTSASDSLHWEIWTDGQGEELLDEIEPGFYISGWTSYVSLSTPSGGWTWAKLQALEVYLNRTGSADQVGVRSVEIEVTHNT